MKKLGIVFFLFIICLVTRTIVLANDGSLRIDTSIHNESKKTEIQFFEQEGDLMKLFQPQTNKIVTTVQRKEEKTYQSDKSNIFIEKVEREDIVDSYQSLLFTSQTMVKNRDNYGISLTQKTQTVSWQMLLLLLVAMVLTISQLLFRKGLTRSKIERLPV